MTVRLLRGISTSIFFRLCWRAPLHRDPVQHNKFYERKAILYCHAACAGSANCAIKRSAMQKCARCGIRMRRVHRTFFERFSYMAIYECKDCSTEEFVPRRFRLHFGPIARCPKCGRSGWCGLKSRTRSIRLNSGLFNLLEKLAGGRLYHWPLLPHPVLGPAPAGERNCRPMRRLKRLKPHRNPKRQPAIAPGQMHDSRLTLTASAKRMHRSGWTKCCTGDFRNSAARACKSGSVPGTFWSPAFRSRASHTVRPR